jgi:putative MATE family efflux protein
MNDIATAAAERPTEQGKFTTGSTMRHVAVMAASGAVGLVSIFAVDLLALLYISWLGNVNYTAGVGYGTTVLFLSTSFNVGLMIASSALVSRALGARDKVRARRLAGSTTAISLIAASLIAIVMMAVMDPLLTLLGATGETHAVAWRFLMICMPSNFLLALGMCFSGTLRSVGDARRAMFVTLSGGIASAIIDPILIFGLELGTDGAAIAVTLSRVVFCLVGYHGVVRIHDLMRKPTFLETVEDLKPMVGIAVPAVLTNIASPVAGAYMTSVLAPYGDEALAANAIISRLVPVAFGTVFALSAAIGPIFGQNLGARNIIRVRRTLTDGLIFSAASVMVAWIVLYLAQEQLIAVFHATGRAADLVRYFCVVLAGTWMFHGALFVANASFNNLGAPVLATVFNWGKATIGTVPFAIVGAQWGGAEGAFLGQGIGAIAFGIVGVWAAYQVINRVERRWQAPVKAQESGS